jgi:signal transduction histidine kinase
MPTRDGEGLRILSREQRLSLRSKILGLYLGLAFAPMVVAGVGSYVQSTRSVGALVETKLSATGEQVAAEMRARYASLSTSLSFLSDYSGTGAVRPATEPWRSLLETFERIEFRDSAGGVVALIEADGVVQTAECVARFAPPVPIRSEIRDPRPRGPTEIVGHVAASALLTGRMLDVRFGRTGRTFVYDRNTGELVYGECEGNGSGPRMADGSGVDPVALVASGASVKLLHDGDELAAVGADVVDVPWTVVVATQPGEFTSPYARMQAVYLGLVLFIALAAGGAFLLLAQHFMSSLEELTDAAERIGQGDLAPWLPPPGNDEVGRLSSAFSRMLARLKATMRQSQSAWQAAAIGGIASQLSHEIRNPLSSIRLNLQSVEREVREGRVPDDLPEVLRVCMREIERLNDAVSGVLEFGRPKPPLRRPCRLGDVVEESIALIRPRMERGGIEVEWERGQVEDAILGDPSQLRGVFLNLFLNAADVMPDGGTLRVWMDQSAARADVRVHVADTGPGIRPELRDQVFEAFFTTRAEGTGIGLSVARQTVEAHGGSIGIEARPESGRGAEFVVVIPVQETPDPDEPDEREGFTRRSRAADVSQSTSVTA